ncbi:MAG TPA: lysophospholipid acyltransferase family protein [Gaiellales bacterium]|jgi:KDO2-lipid IV(A) lauroyltransferase|nr:lysophospholipid acyltransferase family protein [Gaiellales bacterium]
MSSTPSRSPLQRLIHPAAPDGRPRPGAPFGRGPLAARGLGGVIAAAAALGGRLPAPVAHRLAVAGGALEWAARPGKRRTLAVNLGHALGAPPGDPLVRRLVRREIVNEARRSADLLWSIDRPHEMLARTRLEGVEPVLAELAAGRGVIIAGPHIGGWEVAVPVPAAVLDSPVSVLANDDWLAWAVDGIRRRAGLQVVYLSDEPRTMVARLRAGEALLMFADIVPDARTRTLPVRFLDGTVALPAGPVALARMAGAVIVPLAVLPLDARAWVVRLGRPIPAPPRHSGSDGEQAVLQQLADAWSSVIREHPEHWAAVYPLAWTAPA